MPPLITLTTDFGTRDSYVGVMKGVLLGICPTAHLVDITHAITPQNVVEAVFVLDTFVPYFPPGTIHLVVVDPGVGSERRALALATPDAYFVGPDNGVFSIIWQTALARWSTTDVRAVELTEPRFWRMPASATFHGRDIFAPVAAHLAQGVALTALGPDLDTITLLEVPAPVRTDSNSLRGQIVYVDHFGNCISNITTTHLAPFGAMHDLVISVGKHTITGICYTYAAVAPGAALALIGSSGHLEVAIRDGNAHQLLAIAPGTIVVVHRV